MNERKQRPSVEEGKMIAFVNGDAKSNPKAPTHKGVCKIAGKEYDVSIWIGQTKTGSSYISGQIQEPRQQPKAPSVVAVPYGDDSVPF